MLATACETVSQVLNRSPAARETPQALQSFRPLRSPFPSSSLLRPFQHSLPNLASVLLLLFLRILLLPLLLLLLLLPFQLCSSSSAPPDPDSCPDPSAYPHTLRALRHPSAPGNTHNRMVHVGSAVIVLATLKLVLLRWLTTERSVKESDGRTQAHVGGSCDRCHTQWRHNHVNPWQV